MATNKFFTIEFKGGLELINELSQVELELKKVNDAIKEAKKTGDTEVYKKLRLEQEELKKSSQELKKNLRDSIKDFEAQKAPVGSLVALRQEYSKLTKEIQLFSKEQRESAEGLAKIKLAGNLKKEILDIDQSIGDFRSNIGNYKSALLDVGDIVSGGLLTGGITVAIGALASFASSATAAFQESEKAITKVKTAIDTTGAAAGFTAEQLASEAERLQNVTTFDDDDILNKVTAQLLTFTQVTGENFLRAQKAALDLSTVLDGDLQSASIQLGKALENPVKGVTALTKSGVTFTEQQKEQIKVLTEAGKVQEAQGIILDEIAAKYGNQAEALAKTDTGKLEQLKNIFGEFKEDVGAFIVGALAKLTPAIEFIIGKLSIGFKATVTGILTFVNILRSLPKFIEENKGEIIALSVALFALNFNTVLAIGSLIKKNALDLIQLARTKAQTAAQIALNLAMSANPIGLIVAGIALLVAGFIKLYKESETVRNIFSGLYQVFSDFVGYITKIPKAISEVFGGGFLGVFSKIKQYIVDEFKVIAEAFKDISEGRILDGIKKIGTTLLKNNPLTAPLYLIGKNAAESFNKGYNENVKINIAGRGELSQYAERYKKLNDLKKNQQDKNIKDEDKNNNTLSDKQKQAAEKRAKEVEDQEKRIGEIRKAISELSAKEINNVYDKQIAELQNKQETQLQKLEDQRKKLNEKVKGQGGTQTKADITESGLIDQETNAIVQSIEKQKKEIEKKRQESFEDSKQQLLKLQSENLKAIYDNALKVSQSNLESITTGFKTESVKVDIEFETNLSTLKEQYAQGLISQSEFNAQSEKLQSESNQRKLDLEAEHAQRIYNQQINNQKLLEKAIESERKTNERNLDQSNLDAKEKANKDYIEGKIQSEKELNDTLKALDDKLKLDLEANNLSATDKQKAAYQDLIDAKINADKAEIASDEEKTNKKLENLEKEKAKRLEILNTAINYAGQIADTIFEIEAQKDEQRKEDEITKLDEQYKKKLELAQGNATVETALKQEFENKKLAIEKAAFEKNKQRQIKAALANAALAAVQALANTTLPFPLSLTALIPIAISTGLQIAKIKAQEFAEGGLIKNLGNGKIKSKPNTKPTAKGDNVLAYVKAGEVILNERQQELAGGPEFFRSLGVPGFADGGKVPTPNITGYGSSRYNQTITISDEQINKIADVIASRTSDAVKQGAASGTREGSYLGAADNLKLKERQEALIQNTEF